MAGDIQRDIPQIRHTMEALPIYLEIAGSAVKVATPFFGFAHGNSRESM